MKVYVVYHDNDPLDSGVHSVWMTKDSAFKESKRQQNILLNCDDPLFIPQIGIDVDEFEISDVHPLVEYEWRMQH